MASDLSCLRSVADPPVSHAARGSVAGTDRSPAEVGTTDVARATTTTAVLDVTMIDIPTGPQTTVDDAIATTEMRNRPVARVAAAHERPTPAAASHAMKHAVRHHLERSVAEIENVPAHEAAGVSARDPLHPGAAVAPEAPRISTVMYPVAVEVLAVAVLGSAKIAVTASAMIVGLASVMIAVTAHGATGPGTMTAGMAVETVVVGVWSLTATNLAVLPLLRPRIKIGSAIASLGRGVASAAEIGDVMIGIDVGVGAAVRGAVAETDVADRLGGFSSSMYDY